MQFIFTRRIYYYLYDVHIYISFRTGICNSELCTYRVKGSLKLNKITIVVSDHWPFTIPKNSCLKSAELPFLNVSTCA